MALDPKLLLKKNLPLLVCYGAALIPIPLWFVFVSGGVKGGRAAGKGARPPADAWQPVSFQEASQALTQTQKDVDDLEGKIRKNEPVYTTRHNKQFQQRNSEREGQVKAMGALFGERDRQLEQWFEKFKDLDPKKEPPHGDFVAELTIAIERLNQENAKLVGWDPATKRSNLYAESPPNNTPGAMRQWQKRFWIQQEIVAALKAVQDLKLGTPIVFQPPAGGGGGPAPKEKRAYETIPVSFGVVVSFRDVPKVVRELLARPIVFRLMKLDVELMEFQYDKSKDYPGPPPFKVNDQGPKKYFDNFVYDLFIQRERAGEAPDEKASDAILDAFEEKLIPEPPVKMELAVEAFDFDMDVIDPKTGAEPPKEEPKKEEPKKEEPKKEKG